MTTRHFIIFYIHVHTHKFCLAIYRRVWSLPYPLCHDSPTSLVGMAGMPYPPTICKDNSELLLIEKQIKIWRFEEIIVN